MENHKHPQNVSVDVCQHNRGTNAEISFGPDFYVEFTWNDFLSDFETSRFVADLYSCRQICKEKGIEYEG